MALREATRARAPAQSPLKIRRCTLAEALREMAFLAAAALGPEHPPNTWAAAPASPLSASRLASAHAASPVSAGAVATGTAAEEAAAEGVGADFLTLPAVTGLIAVGSGSSDVGFSGAVAVGAAVAVAGALVAMGASSFGRICR